MKILICGDYIVYGKLNSKINNIFGEFNDIVKESDIAIYNQEFPVTDSKDIYITKKYGLLAKSDPDAIRPLAEAGFNYGIKGLKDTINNLNNIGIQYFGAGENISGANRIHYVDKNGIKIAFLNFAENEYNTASDNHGGANPLDIINVVNQIKLAQEKANYIFLIIHGGIDYCKIPSPRMVKMYRHFAEYGVTAIIGHHSHVVSGYEIYKNVPIFYGIGNFIPGKIVNEDCLYSFPVQFIIDTTGKITFRGYPLKYNIEKQQLEMLRGDSLVTFENQQYNISILLKDINMLKTKLMEEYLNIERESYYFTLFTQSNYFLFKVFRKLSLLSIYHKYLKWKIRMNRKNSILWNLFRCETHNDVLDLIYEKHIDTYKND